MKNRYGRTVNTEDSLDSFRDYDRSPSKYTAHKGICACGVETSRMGTSSLVSLCGDHHRLQHAGVIRISGNADEEIIVTGDTEALRFRL